MIKGTNEELGQLVKTHGCPEHPDHFLEVAWHPPDGHVIRCGADHYPEEVKRVPTLTEELRSGAELPQPIADNIKRGLAKTRRQSPLAAQLPELTGIPAADLATGEAVPADKLRALAAWAVSLGLRPELGHVALMYGKPYVEHSGYLYHARRTRQAFNMTTRPLTLEERPVYQVPEHSHAWLCNITLLPDGTHVIGLGIVTLEEMTEMSKKDPTKHRSPVVAAKPWQMTQKRAEHQALKRAFPLGEEASDENT